MQFRIVIGAIVVWLLVLGVLHYAASVRLPGWGAIALYAGIVLVLQRYFSRTGAAADAAIEVRRIWQDWPTSGPIGRFGQTGLQVGMTISGLLCFLNPAQCRQLLAQAIGNHKAGARATRIASNARMTEVVYSLPFEGEWLVYHGGNREHSSHSWQVVAQRYAHDFVVANECMARHVGRGTQVDDYYCHGMPILAAADGIVVSVRSDCTTARFLGYGLVDFLGTDFIGNHLLIQHAAEEYALYAHLAPESIRLRPGDKVSRGQAIGACGHTGHSSEPHLHFHVQDSARIHEGAGLPIRFGPIAVNGKTKEAVLLEVGDRVRNHSAPQPLREAIPGPVRSTADQSTTAHPARIRSSPSR
jgi:hypothetical protein